MPDSPVQKAGKWPKGQWAARREHLGREAVSRGSSWGPGDPSVAGGCSEDRGNMALKAARRQQRDRVECCH